MHKELLEEIENYKMTSEHLSSINNFLAHMFNGGFKKLDLTMLVENEIDSHARELRKILAKELDESKLRIQEISKKEY